MLIYLSGAMTGIKDYNFPLFNEYAKRLRNRGFSVINAAELSVHEDWEWSDYMKRALREMMCATAIALIPGYCQSKGAQLELYLAGVLGIPIYDLAKDCKKLGIKKVK